MAVRKAQSDNEVTPPFRSVAFLLSSIGYAVSRRFHQILEPLQLGPGEFALLRAVSANDGEPQSALAGRLRISPSWMVAVVDELEQRGLLERRPHARDRRVRNLHLTVEGRRLLKQGERKAQRFDRQVTDQLTEVELQRLLELLQKVAAGLDLQPGAHAALRERGS